MQWVGTTTDGAEAKGTVKVTEFSHEVLDGLSEYCVSQTLGMIGPVDVAHVLAVRDQSHVNIRQRRAGTPSYPQKGAPCRYHSQAEHFPAGPIGNAREPDRWCFFPRFGFGI
jgi:hypothetical protein